MNNLIPFTEDVFSEDRGRIRSSDKWKFCKGDVITLQLNHNDDVHHKETVKSKNIPMMMAGNSDYDNELIVIQYLEKDPPGLNMIKMPTRICMYSDSSQFLKETETSLSSNNNTFPRVYVDSSDSLPIICHMKPCSSILIQENNMMSSILHYHNDGDDIFIVNIQYNPKYWISSMYDVIPKFVGVIYRPTSVLISGHCQLKADIAVTFPKQEILHINKRKTIIETMLFNFLSNGTDYPKKRILTCGRYIKQSTRNQGGPIKIKTKKRVVTSSVRTKTRKRLSGPYSNKERESKKEMKMTTLSNNTKKLSVMDSDWTFDNNSDWHVSKKMSLLNVEEYLKILTFNPIIATRLYYNNLDMKRFYIFFKPLFERYRYQFTDVNNAIITMFSISCFPLHTTEMINILHRTQKLLNTSHWSRSINFSNLYRETYIISKGFMPSICPIFRTYFKNSELKKWDVLLEKYIESIGKRIPVRDTVTGKFGSNSLKNNESFYFIRRSLIKAIYFLEHIYMDRMRYWNVDSKSIRSKDSIDHDVMRKVFAETVKNKVSPKSTGEKSIDERSKNEIFDQNVMLDSPSNLRLLENDILRDLISLGDISVIYDYKCTVKELNKNKIFDKIKKKKEKLHKKKLKGGKARFLEIKYSKIFSKDSKYKLNLHPEIESKLSNPYKIVMKEGVDKCVDEFE